MPRTPLSRILCLSTALCWLGLAGGAQAQMDNQRYDDNARVERLERDVQMLQRQVARGGGAPATYSTGGGDMTGPAAANLEVRLTELEESIRRLQGKIEEVEFKNRSLSERIDRMAQDNELRFQQLQNNGGGMKPSMKPSTDTDNDDQAMTDDAAQEHAIDVPAENVKSRNHGTLTETDEGVTASTETAPTVGKLSPPTPPSVDSNGEKTFNTPAEQYNYAYRLLNQSKTEESAAAFEKFLKKYPKDPLVGNAYYWLGESYYVRHDYVKSANYFRQGFETAPKGPKAADNLLKLSMSLSAINRTKESCVVLNQLVLKFGKSSTSVKQKAEQEINRIGCK